MNTLPRTVELAQLLVKSGFEILEYKEEVLGSSYALNGDKPRVQEIKLTLRVFQ